MLEIITFKLHFNEFLCNTQQSRKYITKTYITILKKPIYTINLQFISSETITTSKSAYKFNCFKHFIRQLTNFFNDKNFCIGCCTSVVTFPQVHEASPECTEDPFSYTSGRAVFTVTAAFYYRDIHIKFSETLYNNIISFAIHVFK